MSSSERLLEKINTPDDLRKLKRLDLVRLSNELRQHIIDEVSHNPGHLGASLGVVELTVAFIMSTTPLMTRLSGMWVIRLTGTRY